MALRRLGIWDGAPFENSIMTEVLFVATGISRSKFNGHRFSAWGSVGKWGNEKRLESPPWSFAARTDPEVLGKATITDHQVSLDDDDTVSASFQWLPNTMLADDTVFKCAGNQLRAFC